MLRYTDNKVHTLYINSNWQQMQQYALFVDRNTVNLYMEYILQLTSDLTQQSFKVCQFCTPTAAHELPIWYCFHNNQPLTVQNCPPPPCLQTFRTSVGGILSSLHKGQFLPSTALKYHISDNCCPHGMQSHAAWRRTYSTCLPDYMEQQRFLRPATSQL